MKKIFGIIIITVLYGAWTIFRPLGNFSAEIYATQNLKNEIPDLQINITPLGTQAIKAVDTNFSLGFENEKIVSIASTAKVMLAILIADKYANELLGNAQPTYTFTNTDYSIYLQMRARNESLLDIKAGETYTLTEMLEALLMKSANNVALKLAETEFGTVEEYTKLANFKANEIGMRKTNFVDASDFNSETKSTANDLVILGTQFSKNKTLSTIARQQDTTLANGMLIENTNKLLADGLVDGIKTGTTDEAGNCLLFSYNINDLKFIGSILGYTSKEAIKDEITAVKQQLQNNITEMTKYNKSIILGSYKTQLGQTIDIFPSSNIKITQFKNEKPYVAISINDMDFNKKSSYVGNLTIKTQLMGEVSYPLIIKRYSKNT